MILRREMFFVGEKERRGLTRLNCFLVLLFAIRFDLGLHLLRRLLIPPSNFFGVVIEVSTFPFQKRLVGGRFDVP